MWDSALFIMNSSYGAASRGITPTRGKYWLRWLHSSTNVRPACKGKHLGSTGFQAN